MGTNILEEAAASISMVCPEIITASLWETSEQQYRSTLHPVIWPKVETFTAYQQLPITVLQFDQPLYSTIKITVTVHSSQTYDDVISHVVTNNFTFHVFMFNFCMFTLWQQIFSLCLEFFSLHNFLNTCIRGSYRKSWATIFCMRTGNSRRRGVLS